MMHHFGRRRFLQQSGMGLGGLALAGTLRLSAATDTAKSLAATKLLMLDPRSIQRRENVDLRLERPARHPANPLIRPEKPWEFGYLYNQSAHYDAEAKRWRMWCASVQMEPDEIQRLCVLESDDGLAWRRPEFDLVELNGSKHNGLCPGPVGIVYIDPRDPDPKRRYKMVAATGNNVVVAWSADGTTWTESAKPPTFAHCGDTHAFYGWDERIGKYVAYWRLHFGAPTQLVIRKYAYATSDDFLNWSEPQPIEVNDAHDPWADQIYQIIAFPVGDLYVCLAPVLHIDRNGKDLKQPDPAGGEQTIDVQLMTSYDGIAWRRHGNRQPWLALATSESWDDTQIWPSVPVTIGDETRIYYTGVNLRHHVADLKRCGKMIDGRWLGGCIGLATLGRDRWMSAAAGNEPGEILTKAFQYNGGRILLNAETTGGTIAAELTDPEGHVLDGCGRKACQVGKREGLLLPIDWQGANLASLNGRQVALRVLLQQAKLYAIEVEARN